jgi:hypothetical protein
MVIDIVWYGRYSMRYEASWHKLGCIVHGGPYYLLLQLLQEPHIVAFVLFIHSALRIVLLLRAAWSMEILTAYCILVRSKVKKTILVNHNYSMIGVAALFLYLYITVKRKDEEVVVEVVLLLLDTSTTTSKPPRCRGAGTEVQVERYTRGAEVQRCTRGAEKQ